MAERTGWTFEHIDAMDWDEFWETVTIYDAYEQARSHVRKRAERHAQASSKGRRG